MDELERLQRRAYGPGSDIAGDVTAMARLSELEATQREPSPVVDAPAAPWWRRRRWLAIIGITIAALALNAALVAWMSQLLAPESTPTKTDTSTAKMLPPVPDAQGRGDLVLAPDYVLALESFGADADEPKDPRGILNSLGLSSDELGRYEDFRGLSIWSGESRYGMACLLVAHSGQGLREGIGDEGCSPEGLDTIAELEYGGNGYSPGEVFADLPTGSLIRFVLRDDRVDVYLYVSANDPIASQGWQGRPDQPTGSASPCGMPMRQKPPFTASISGYTTCSSGSDRWHLKAIGPDARLRHIAPQKIWGMRVYRVPAL